MAQKSSGIVPIVILVIIIAAGLFIYFEKITWLDVILKPTPREKYERSLEKYPEQLAQWHALTMMALNDSIIIDDKISLQLYNEDAQPYAASYLLKAAYGERIMVQLNEPSDSISAIIEILDEQLEVVSSIQKDSSRLVIDYPVEKSGSFRLIVQSKLNVPFNRQLKVWRKPRFSFPVAGKTNRAIQSFWGAPRGGGKRIHKGNDIFAVKGHPVLAISNGRVRSIRNRGLGGKQIWLRDKDTGLSLYYAHLNGWNVKQGVIVKEGDTIGYVGNTGNARTTPPHLHFGIYGSTGAIDPKPFIWQTQKPADLPRQNLENLKVISTSNKANLRLSPTTKSGVVRKMNKDSLTILGKTGSWYHVRMIDSLAGFAHKSVLRL